MVPVQGIPRPAAFPAGNFLLHAQRRFAAVKYRMFPRFKHIVIGGSRIGNNNVPRAVDNKRQPLAVRGVGRERGGIKFNGLRGKHQPAAFPLSLRHRHSKHQNIFACKGSFTPAGNIMTVFVGVFRIFGRNKIGQNAAVGKNGLSVRTLISRQRKSIVFILLLQILNQGFLVIQQTLLLQRHAHGGKQPKLGPQQTAEVIGQLTAGADNNSPCVL